jgi:hypothetical protein
MDIVQPDYSSISVVADICDEWIELWSGDEWGESMRSLHGACHTSYGFSNEDCALFANKLLENLCSQKEWMDEEGDSYGLYEPAHRTEVEKKCRELRDYWLKGGNLGAFGVEHGKAKETIEKLPAWLFGK